MTTQLAHGIEVSSVRDLLVGVADRAVHAGENGPDDLGRISAGDCTISLRRVDMIDAPPSIELTIARGDRQRSILLQFGTAVALSALLGVAVARLRTPGGDAVTKPLDSETIGDVVDELARELAEARRVIRVSWHLALGLAHRLRAATASRHDSTVIAHERAAIISALDGDLEMLPHPRGFSSEARAQLFSAAAAAAVEGVQPRRSMLVKMALGMHRRQLERELDALIDLTLEDAA